MEQIVAEIGDMSVLYSRLESDEIIAKCIYHVLETLSPPDDPSDISAAEYLKNGRFTRKQLPKYSGLYKFGKILASLEGLMKFCGSKSYKELFSPRILLLLVLEFRLHLSKTVFFSDRCFLYCSFKTCLLLNSDGLLHPLLFQWTIAFLLELLCDPDMTSDVAGTIAALCDRMATTNLQIYSRFVSGIVSKLMEAVYLHESTKAQVTISKAILAVLKPCAVDEHKRLVQLSLFRLDRGNPNLSRVFSELGDFLSLSDDDDLPQLFSFDADKFSLNIALSHLQERLKDANSRIFMKPPLCTKLVETLLFILKKHASSEDRLRILHGCLI